MERLMRTMLWASLPCAFLLGFVLATAARGEESETAAASETVEPVWTETIKVELEDRDEPKHPTLRFLSENRDFFRGRLDQLLLTLERNRSAEGLPLDPRYLMYRDMMDQIRAARDSTEVSEEWIRRRGLLESVGELVELETEMDEMETLLSEQRQRLVWLEEDFTGRQTTALVVLLTGVPAMGVPRAVTLTGDDGDNVRISLDEESRYALAQGGSVQLVHEFVEPRDLRFEISFEGDTWVDQRPFEVAIAPERDRLTFLELDATNVVGAGVAETGVDGTAEPGSLSARAWTR